MIDDNGMKPLEYPPPTCTAVTMLQPYKVVTAWRYEDSPVDVPWKDLGDVLFEMGAASVAIDVTNPEVSTGRTAHEEEGLGDRPWLTFTVSGARDVGAALGDACALVGPADCFGEASDSWAVL